MALLTETPETRITLRRLLKRPRYRYMVVNRIVPHLPWLALMAMAALTYKARIFSESGVYFAEFINNQFFWVENQRIVSVIPQIIPLAAVWIGLEIKYVLLLYSLSHVAFFYFLFLFVYYGLRDRRSGLLIILSQTVGITYSFFTPAFELFYAFPLLISFYAIWQLPFRFRAIFVMLVIEIVILLSHPVAFILFVFILAYNFRLKTAKPFKFYLPVILVFVGTALAKYLLMGSDEWSKVIEFFSYSGNKSFTELINPMNYGKVGLYMLRSFTEVIIALLIVIGMLVKKKQWIRLAVVTTTFLLYLLLVNSAYPFSSPDYMEQLMYPFIPIVFIPLIYGFPLIGRQGLLNISILLVSGLIVYRLAVIYYGGESFMRRVAQMEQLIQVARQKGGDKFIVNENAADHGYSILNWSYPIETMLLSAIDGNDISVTIVPQKIFNTAIPGEGIGAAQFIFRNKQLKTHSWLNQKYFHMDIGPYRTLNDTISNKNTNIAASNLRIVIHSKSIYQSMDTAWVPVSIINQGESPIYSGLKNNVYLSYFWVVKNDVLNWNEIRTPLQADIVRYLKQDIKVAIPRQKGRMQLKVDIIADGNWLGIYSQEDVLVY